MNKTLFILTVTLLQFHTTKINAQTVAHSLMVKDSITKHAEQNKPQNDLSGIEFVDIKGVIKKEGDKFVLHSKDKKHFV